MFEIFFLVFASILFLGFMANRMIKSLFSGKDAVYSLQQVLDDVRYIIAFVGAIVAQLLVYQALERFFKQYDMPPLAYLIVQVTMFMFTIVYSASISGGIIHAERSIGEGGLKQRQLISVLVILAIFLPMEWNSLVLGLEKGFGELEKYRVDNVKEIKSIDKLSIDGRAELVALNNKRVKEIDLMLSDKEHISFTPDKEYQKRLHDYNWCANKYKAKAGQMCANLKSKLDAKKMQLKKEAEQKLIKERNRLLARSEVLLDKRDKKITAVKTEQEKKIIEIKKQTAENNLLAKKIVTAALFIGFAVSVLRSLLSPKLNNPLEQTKEEQTEQKEIAAYEKYKPTPVTEIKLSKQELQHKYIVKAMKQWADMKGYVADNNGFVTAREYPRDDIVKLAKHLASKDGIALQIGNPRAKKMIDDWDTREEVNDYIRERSKALDKAG